MLTLEAVAAIVQRVFRERASTLLAESLAIDTAALVALSAELRGRMGDTLTALPPSAFEPAPGRLAGEPGWTAGEIVSHNSDRLLWALGGAAAVIGERSLLPPAPVLVERSAAREPRALSRDLSLEVLAAASVYLGTAMPVLTNADRGQTATTSHHGPMGVRSWLLLVCIHDADHLGQMQARA